MPAVQKTADFLKNNKLGHCVTWNPNEPDGGQGVLPPFTPPAASPGSKQHAVRGHSQAQGAGSRPAERQLRKASCPRQQS